MTTARSECCLVCRALAVMVDAGQEIHLLPADGDAEVCLFDVVVAAVLGFCAGSFALSCFMRGQVDTFTAELNIDLQGVQSLCVPQLAVGLRRSTPRQLLLREFGYRPLVHGWLQAIFYCGTGWWH